ncbi:dihydropteroate synthase [Rhodoferax sp.]|uniref:dihydropteroate synthase n=1 Tax=Rhodoferax sp. TaxID=50421 RepID=UPI0027364076|nr:dihydropteroate synthase [Rhodoferax sp.]MDP3190629.1 dihydropteroate synthase [Rhodoferax sp.]MDP3337669.1 dihydropteroate synthase [Rhodoferax sp.]
MFWQTSRYHIDLTRPKVMGIVNVTPDSFSDGGQHGATLSALRHCEQLIRDGADILDIGGESTRPGAPPVSLADELARVLPVLREAVRLGVPVSLDSYKPRVMQAALDLGVDIINDIWALRWREGGTAGHTLRATEVVAAHPHCGVCLMHMHRDPQTMQVAPMAGDVLPQVRDFLAQAAHDLQALGVGKSRIMLDPGIGFGKTVAQNFALLARQAELLETGYPVLAGWSRKSSLAGMLPHTAQPGTTLPVTERLAASLACALLAAERGASVLRVHDVKETAQALRVLEAIT